MRNGASGETVALPATTRRITIHFHCVLAVGMERTNGSPLAWMTAACAQFHVSHASTIQTSDFGMHGQGLSSAVTAIGIASSRSRKKRVERLAMIVSSHVKTTCHAIVTPV